jgi:hypothetical protein
LHYFTGGTDGAIPEAALVQGSDGYFYGTTYGYTHYDLEPYGTVFKISRNGALTTLYSFTGGADGSGPDALVQAPDGSFYGTTDGGVGTVFRLTILPEFQGMTLTKPIY